MTNELDHIPTPEEMARVSEALADLDRVEFHAVGKNGERVVFRVLSHERTALELVRSYDQDAMEFHEVDPLGWDPPCWRRWTWAVTARTTFRAEDFQKGERDA